MTTLLFFYVPSWSAQCSGKDLTGTIKAGGVREWKTALFLAFCDAFARDMQAVCMPNLSRESARALVTALPCHPKKGNSKVFESLVSPRKPRRVRQYFVPDRRTCWW